MKRYVPVSVTDGRSPTLWTRPPPSATYGSSDPALNVHCAAIVVARSRLDRFDTAVVADTGLIATGPDATRPVNAVSTLARATSPASTSSGDNSREPGIMSALNSSVRRLLTMRR